MEVRMTQPSEITIRPVRWLWQDRLAVGTLGLLGGREGVGKSICAYTIAASVTRGTLSDFRAPSAVPVPEATRTVPPSSWA